MPKWEASEENIQVGRGNNERKTLKLYDQIEDRTYRLCDHKQSFKNVTQKLCDISSHLTNMTFGEIDMQLPYQ